MIKTIMKMQPRIQEVADNLVFVHPEVKRHSVGWQVKEHFVADKESGNWREALKRCHQMLAQPDSIYEFNVLNNMLDIPVKLLEVQKGSGQTVPVFRNIVRTMIFGRPAWMVERSVKGVRISKCFVDRNYKNNWEESLKAATIYLLKELGRYKVPEAPIEYPKVSAFLFKNGQVRLSVATSTKNIAAYVHSDLVTQESLNTLVDSLYCEWVWYQSMINKFGESVARGIRKPEKLDHWRRDNFPKLDLDDLLKRIKH